MVDCEIINNIAVPTYDNLYNPLIQALKQLGGSVSEIEEKVAEIINLSEEDISEIYRNNTTKLSYRLAWTRTRPEHTAIELLLHL